MAYRVFYTDGPLPTGQRQPDYATLIPFEEPTTARAVERACALIAAGAIVWRIDGPDKLYMTRREIEQACRGDRL